MTSLEALHRRAGVSPERLLIYLHGAGETGGDADAQVLKHGPWEDVRFRPTGRYHADTIARIREFHRFGLHLSRGDWDPAIVDGHIRRHIKEHSLDPEHLYITGISRGGRAAIRLAIYRLRSNQCVSALAVFCPEGGAREYSDEDIRALRRAPVFLFHCPEDDTVPFEGSAMLHRMIGSDVSRLRIVHLSELAEPKNPHVCWTEVYGSPTLYEWLMNPEADPAAWPHMHLPYV